MSNDTEPQADRPLAELNIFVEKDGKGGHIKITGISFNKAAAKLDELMEAVEKHNYTVLQGPNDRTHPPVKERVGAAKPKPKVREARRASSKSDVECEVCGGPTWDNTEDKRSPKAPDYKCKDRDGCGAAAWIQEDGELKWVEG